MESQARIESEDTHGTIDIASLLFSALSAVIAPIGGCKPAADLCRIAEQAPTDHDRDFRIDSCHPPRAVVRGRTSPNTPADRATPGIAGQRDSQLRKIKSLHEVVTIEGIQFIKGHEMVRLRIAGNILTAAAVTDSVAVAVERTACLDVEIGGAMYVDIL